MKKAILMIIPVIFFLDACALEIANVIGPGGGYVFYDKGNYDGGWRYIECSQFDFGEITSSSNENIQRAIDLCNAHSDGRYRFPWEVPDEAYLSKMLECFTYGLTQFKSDVYYLSVNNLYHPVPAYPALPAVPDADKGEAAVLYMNFNNTRFGAVEKAGAGFSGAIRVRPIRRF